MHQDYTIKNPFTILMCSVTFATNLMKKSEMLNSLRSIAGSWSAKILLLLLVVSFGVWGIGDVLRTSGRNPTIATIGATEISAAEYLHALHREAENLRASMGGDYSPDMLKNPMLNGWVLRQLVNNALMRQEADAIGLVPGDAEVVRRIRSDQMFQDNSGNFDKKIFEARLSGLGMSEKNYVKELKAELATSILMDTLTGTIPVPATEVRTLLEAREERRSVTVYALTPELVSNVAVPDEKQIKAYYDAHSKEFTVPEYRNLSYVAMTAADVRKDAPVSQDQLKAAYNERIDEFKRPERRTIEQLLFASEEQAKKAYDMAKGGTPFDDIAAQMPVLNKDTIMMGKVEKKDLILGADDAVFALPKDGVTTPIQSAFGWHVFHVTGIVPPATLSLEEARPTLEKELKQQNAENGLSHLTNAFEDALAGGNTLAEAARDQGLKVLTVGSVDHQGNAQNGRPNRALPDLDRFLDKMDYADNPNVILTERGASFGYNTLVTDMRALPIMAETGCPVVFDATHSVQQPGGQGGSSGGQRKFVATLAKAAVAVGVAGVFMETHQDPDNAPSDGPCMMKFDDMELLLVLLKEYDKIAKAL